MFSLLIEQAGFLTRHGEETIQQTPTDMVYSGVSISTLDNLDVTNY